MWVGLRLRLNPRPLGQPFDPLQTMPEICPERGKAFVMTPARHLVCLLEVMQGLNAAPYAQTRNRIRRMGPIVF